MLVLQDRIAKQCHAISGVEAQRVLNLCEARQIPRRPRPDIVMPEGRDVQPPKSGEVVPRSHVEGLH